MPNKEESDPKKRRIFREASLARLASPERVDDMLVVVKPPSWIALVTLAGLIVMVLVWSIIGRVPIQVAAMGMVLPRSQVPGLDAQLGEEATPEDDRLVGVFCVPLSGSTQVKPGLSTVVLPDSVPADRFGHLSGKVIAFSRTPTSPEDAARVFRSGSFVQAVVPPTGCAMLVTDLAEDASTSSGLSWSSSKGPDYEVEPGTPALLKVVTGYDPPIAFVLPMWRGDS